MNFFDHNKKTNFIKNIEEKIEDIYEEIPYVKEKRKKKTRVKIFYSALIVVIFLIILSIVFTAFNLKNVYSQSIKGKNNLTASLFFIKRGEYEKSLGYSQAAEKNFGSALSILQNKKSFLFNLPLIRSQHQDGKNLIGAAYILSKTATGAINFAEKLNSITQNKGSLRFSKFTETEKKEILKYIFESGPELTGLKANLDLALLNLKNINYRGLFFVVKPQIEKIEEQINTASDYLELIIPFTKFLPELAGYPEQKSFLFLLQNQDELRPTGGFIGSYGVVEAKFGDIIKFDTHDIYHLDMPIKDKLKIEPPEPIKNYLVPLWYMRDSNWSPDFEESANQIIWFYKQENKLLPNSSEIKDLTIDFDGVIGITPELITDLLKITGPIIIDGEEYNEDNFTQILEYQVEKGYVQLGVPRWHRKEIIGEIATNLKNRLFDLPLQDWPSIIEITRKNIAKKNILLYFKDDGLERLAEQENMAGKIKQLQGDYLMIVDANMRALKTDSVMDRKINYEVSESKNGLIAKLKITYAHGSEDVDWRTSGYRSFTRVYVPKGSALIKATGYSEKSLDVGEELGKAFFGMLITVAPGQIKTIELEYKLPSGIINNDKYNLYIQKQPGNRISQLEVNLNLNKEIKNYKPIGFSAEKINHNQIKWVTDFLTDKSYSILITN